jgi:hypothetical protein
MKMFVFAVFFVFWPTFNTQECVKSLNEKLFTLYDYQSRPAEHASNLTEVCVGLYIVQISGVHEQNQVRHLGPLLPQSRISVALSP